MECNGKVAEAALADEHVRGGDRLALQRRALRLGKPPRRWKQPLWIDQVPRDPSEVCQGFKHAPDFMDVCKQPQRSYEHRRHALCKLPYNRRMRYILFQIHAITRAKVMFPIAKIEKGSPFFRRTPFVRVLVHVGFVHSRDRQSSTISADLIASKDGVAPLIRGYL